MTLLLLGLLLSVRNNTQRSDASQLSHLFLFHWLPASTDFPNDYLAELIGVEHGSDIVTLNYTIV